MQISWQMHLSEVQRVSISEKVSQTCSAGISEVLQGVVTLFDFQFRGNVAFFGVCSFGSSIWQVNEDKMPKTQEKMQKNHFRPSTFRGKWNPEM